ncbi:MAG TPA: hypothetical protein VEQ42_11075 [Pyrinomonadaceae bacterium]|nr:hypothetical protein [Pyrinomonadaceae bacterium]
MAIFKKKNEQTESRLLLESDDPVELPPAEIDDSAVVVNFDAYRPYLPELLEALRAGTVADPVPVMLDGSTFVVHGATRSFWVKLWHTNDDLDHIVRAQVVSCMPSTRGVQIYVAGLDDEDDDFDEEDRRRVVEEDFDEEDEDFDEDDLDDEDESFEDDEEEDDASPGDTPRR